jgi:hypothetical protein
MKITLLIRYPLQGDWYETEVRMSNISRANRGMLYGSGCSLDTGERDVEFLFPSRTLAEKARVEMIEKLPLHGMQTELRKEG